jgi:hypothetical protein
MAKRSIEYAQEIGASAIQVFASSPRMWAMPAAKPELDEAYKIKAAEMDLETYVHAPERRALHHAAQGGSMTPDPYEDMEWREFVAQQDRRDRNVGIALGFAALAILIILLVEHIDAILPYLPH